MQHVSGQLLEEAGKGIPGILPGQLVTENDLGGAPRFVSGTTGQGKEEGGNVLHQACHMHELRRNASCPS